MNDRIAKVILESGLSIPKFATAMKVSKNTLIRYRDGTNPPPGDFLERLCKQFSVNPGWLLLGEGTMKGPAPCGTAKPSELDTDILSQVIIGIEKALAEKRRTLPPEKKAQLISLLYEYYSKADEEVNDETVEKYLRLAI